MTISINNSKVTISNYSTMAAAKLALGGVAPTITIGTMPFTRTVAPTGSYTFTGTATDATSITWSASPSGASGTVTGDLSSWSTVVTITPDTAGEGVETITFTATNAYGSGTDSETVGFYIPGAHTIFHAQNINGSYNVGLSDTNAISQWNNLGSSGFHATQGTGANQPLYRTNILNGQPVVRFDGSNDSLQCASSVLTDWDFLTGADLVSAESVATVTDANTWTQVWSTISNTRGAFHGIDFRSTTASYYARHSNINANSSNIAVSGRTSLNQSVRNDSGASDVIMYIDGTNRGTVGTATSEIAGEKFQLGDSSNTSLSPMSGDIWRVFIYDLALSTTQLGINKAIDEWALGATLPIN